MHDNDSRLCLGRQAIGAAVTLALGIMSGSAAEVPPKTEFFDLAQLRITGGAFQVAQQTDAAYLLKLEPDRLMSWFYREAGLPEKAAQYGGWESSDIGGFTSGHYLSAISQMYAATGNEEFRRRAEYIVGEYASCQKSIGTGYVSATPQGKTVFAQIKAGKIEPSGDLSHLNNVWVPWYVMHKELAGLLDANHYCHNQQALEVAEKLADWIDGEVSGLNHDQMQRMLEVEHGGIAEALANLSAVSGQEKYLTLALKFRHDSVFLPFVQGNDILDGHHANTQIPKFTGYQRIYELTGEADYDAAAENFWKAVTQNRSWVTGANSAHELFFPGDQFAQQMNDPLGPETCNSYNMLKLTEHIFQQHPDGVVMDYYERTLYNHILASIRPHQDGFIYYTPLAPGSYRTYSAPFDSFWCCVGTGMENPAKYGKAIYAHEGTDKLLVNLFIASTLDWSEAGIKVEQKTDFPEEPGTSLVVHPKEPKAFAIAIRYPAWVAAGALKLSVNGEPQAITAQPGAYAVLKRIWKEGDTIRVETPMTLQTALLPHSTNYVAIMYGPLVLAGKLGLQGLAESNFTSLLMDPATKLPESKLPVITQPLSDVVAHLKPVEGSPLTFLSDGLIQPRDVRFVPFYKLVNERYSVYWHVVDAATWQHDQSAISTAAEKLEAGTIDRTYAEAQPEADHNLVGDKSRSGHAPDGKPWRDAVDGGSFSYQMKVSPDAALELACEYSGSDAGPRNFEVSVDGTVVGQEDLKASRPGIYYYSVYALPPALLKDKKSVTVKFAAAPGNVAGGVFDCRIVKAGAIANGTPAADSMADTAVNALGGALPSGNPIFTGSDPDVTISGGKFWIYPTYQGRFDAMEIRAYSSPDLVTWTESKPLLSLAEVKWAPDDGAGHYLWAPGIFQKNNRFYMYFALGPQGATPSRIGVATCDSPDGHFVDSGKVLVTGGNGFEAIDPMVFEDPKSGKAYLYAGGSAGSTLHVYELNPDLVTVARQVPVDNPANFTEGSYMAERNGIYYLSYSSGHWNDNTYSVHYCTAPSPVGPWTYKGVILKSDDVNWGPGHHAFLKNPADGQWYIVYHRWNHVKNGQLPPLRSVCIEKMSFDVNGDIQPVAMTDTGVPATSSPLEGSAMTP